MDGWDDFYHNGAFLLPHAFDFYSSFGWPRPRPRASPTGAFNQGTPDEYQFFLNMGPLSNANANYFHHQVAFWDTLTAHDHWDDFWAARNILPHLENLRPATLVVGGRLTPRTCSARSTATRRTSGSRRAPTTAW